MRSQTILGMILMLAVSSTALAPFPITDLSQVGSLNELLPQVTGTGALSPNPGIVAELTAQLADALPVGALPVAIPPVVIAHIRVGDAYPYVCPAASDKPGDAWKTWQTGWYCDDPDRASDVVIANPMKLRVTLVNALQEGRDGVPIERSVRVTLIEDTRPVNSLVVTMPVQVESYVTRTYQGACDCYLSGNVEVHFYQDWVVDVPVGYVSPGHSYEFIVDSDGGGIDHAPTFMVSQLASQDAEVSQTREAMVISFSQAFWPLLAAIATVLAAAWCLLRRHR